MELYSNKAEVYASVDRLRRKFSVTLEQYPIEPRSLLKQYPRIIVQETSFVTEGLRGIALIAKCTEDPHIIFLGIHRNKKEQKFDLCHELYHVSFHGKFNSSFKCLYENTGRNPRYAQLEWQANTGAAEFLMPYRLVVPFLAENIDCYPSLAGIYYLTHTIAERFGVTPAAAELRAYELQYEAWRLFSGDDLDDIIPLSRASQDRCGCLVNLHRMKNLQHFCGYDDRFCSSSANLSSVVWKPASFW